MFNKFLLQPIEEVGELLEHYLVLMLAQKWFEYK